MKFRNKFKSIRTLVLGVIVFGLASCSDNLLDLNVDPNSPTTVPASNLVTQAQYNFFDRMHSRVLNGEWGMLMVQHWAQNEYCEESRYVVDGNSFDGTWQNFYASSLNELSVARSIIEGDETVVGAARVNQLAIIDIMKTVSFQTLTELWGDVPYTEALNTEFPKPSYDTQADIWSDLLASLDASVASIDVSGGSFVSGDIVYNGDMTAWKKLGASLLLRMAMRVSDVDDAAASTYVGKAIGHGVLESSADNAVFNFSSDPSTANPLYIDNVINNRDDFAVSEPLVTTLTAMGDPRLSVYAAETNSGEIIGMPYGLTDPEAFALKDNTSRPATVRDATSPHVFIDYAEVSFLLAEAVERGYTSGDAAEHYANGVTASMNFWGFDDTAGAISGYIAANPYDAANWKQSLGMQKWIAFYSNGVQAWAEWRRLDFPQLAVPAAANIPVIPVRLPYPVSEQDRNGDNLGAVTDDPNDMQTKLIWDVN